MVHAVFFFFVAFCSQRSHPERLSRFTALPAAMEAFAVRRKAVGRASGDAAFGVLKLLAVPHPLVRNIAEGKPSPRRPWPAVSAFSFATEGAVTQTGSGPLGRHE